MGVRNGSLQCFISSLQRRYAGREPWRDSRSALPVEETATLVHWWKIAACAYALYEEKLPDREPPLLSSACLLEDD